MPPQKLLVEIVDIQGQCPVFRVGDAFHIVEGYILINEIPVCMHALLSLGPYYVALSRSLSSQEIGLAGADGAAYVQCLDPQRYTGGGTVTFRLTVQPDA